MRTIFVRPQMTSLKVAPSVDLLKKEEEKPKDLQLIYEQNDLFGTYRPTITPMKPLELLPNIPQPPAPKILRRQPSAPIQFLEPLPIKITGIIASSNETKSQVTVMNNSTRRSETYHVGDKIVDANIVRIFPNKILIVRSNGQQETIFIYPSDAQDEIKNLQDTSWSDVIEVTGNGKYRINPAEFAHRISSLAEFIDLLDLATVTKSGRSAGLQVGRMKPQSIGYAAGFMPGDLITKVQNIDPTTTKNRMKLYNEIIKLPLKSQIKVQFLRRGQLITNTYTLFGLGVLEETEPKVPEVPEVKALTPPVSVPPTPQLPAPSGPPAPQELPQKLPVAAGPAPAPQRPAVSAQIAPPSAPAAQPKIQPTAVPTVTAAPAPAAPALPVAPPTSGKAAVPTTTPAEKPSQPAPAAQIAQPPTAPQPAPSAQSITTALQKQDFDAMRQFGGKPPSAVTAPSK
jgi:type II secretory pathway component PulC